MRNVPTVGSASIREVAGTTHGGSESRIYVTPIRLGLVVDLRNYQVVQQVKLCWVVTCWA